MSDDQVETTERGFRRFPPIPDTYGGEVRVYESSSAEEAAVWLTVTDVLDKAPREATVHLALAEAAQVARQLTWLVENHYHNETL